MKTYVCPEFAATGIELQIIELEAQREAASEQGWADEASGYDDEIAQLWSRLAELADHLPESNAPAAA
ncbi:MAG: hypothetical protein U5K29_12465 [Acidimicrobiales bacterium]|nr:hypothetical protein [Acidimicrobiales bacterium]